MSASDTAVSTSTADGESDTASEELAWLFDSFSNLHAGLPAMVVLNITFNRDGTADFQRYNSCDPSDARSAVYRWTRISANEVELFSDPPEPIILPPLGAERTRWRRMPDCEEVQLGYIVDGIESTSPDTWYRGAKCLSTRTGEDCSEARTQYCGPEPPACSESPDPSD